MGAPPNFLRHKMPNEFRSHVDLFAGACKQLGISTASTNVLREEEARRKTLSRLLEPCDAAKMAQDLVRQYGVLMEPMGEAGRDPFSDVRKLINVKAQEKNTYEHLFRLPALSELGSIANEAIKATDLARTVLGTASQLQENMAKMHSPWLQVGVGFNSAKAFSEIISIGNGINCLPAFDHRFATALRPAFGDWRDPLTPVAELLISPILRSGFYLERGFDPSLTDFTLPAFDESLRIAGLRDDLDSTESGDDSENKFARAKEAFGTLQRFELSLRRFIERKMQSVFGDDWMRKQLPVNMLDNWIDKQCKAVKAGSAEQPLIDYADFSDYKMIIERRDNWISVFKAVFSRPEDVRESFQRLYPVRIATMHARVITQDDELLLLVETKRILKAIDAN